MSAQPEVAEDVEAGGVRRSGHVHGGRVLLRQRVRRRHLLRRCDVLRLPRVSAGLVCALEPIGLMRRVGLGETLRIALMGNDERVSADTALRIGLVSEVVARRPAVGARARDRATIAAKPPSATQGTVKAIWESLDKPYRAAMEQSLIYTRLGNPLGQAELAAPADGGAATTEDSVMTDHPLSRRIADVLDLRAGCAGASNTTANGFRGDRSAQRRAASSRCDRRDGLQVGILLRNRPAHVAALPRRAAGRRDRRRHQPVPRRRAHQGRHRLAAAAAGRRRARRSGDAGDTAGEPRPCRSRISTTAPTSVRPAEDSAPTPAVGVAVRMLTSGTTGPPKRIDLTYDMLAHSVMGATPTARRHRRSCAAVSRSSTRRWCTSAACSGCCNACARRDRLRCWTGSSSTRWAEAVRRHRPQAVSLVPAALRTVLHSDLTRDDLAQHPRRHLGHRAAVRRRCRRVHRKVRHPGADLLCRNGIRRRRRGLDAGRPPEVLAAPSGAASGRASLGAQLRVVDDDGAPLGPDQAGLLEVKPGQLGPSADWMRTTDMARIDADGFLWILGRADQAIIRGGFKVMPDDVRTALESHPAVQGAAVVGRPRRRDSARRRSPWWNCASRSTMPALLESPANTAGALRDSHRHRDRRADPENAVRKARPGRCPTLLQRRRRTCLRPPSPKCCASRPAPRASTRCWSATPTVSATPRPIAVPRSWPAG